MNLHCPLKWLICSCRPATSIFLFERDLCAEIWFRSFYLSSLVSGAPFFGFLLDFRISFHSLIFCSDSKKYLFGSVSFLPRFLDALVPALSFDSSLLMTYRVFGVTRGIANLSIFSISLSSFFVNLLFDAFFAMGLWRVCAGLIIES